MTDGVQQPGSVAAPPPSHTTGGLSLTDVTGLRFSGIFPPGREPSIRTLREWTRGRRIPFHQVGHFVCYDVHEVAEHIRTELRVPPMEMAFATVQQKTDKSGAERTPSGGLGRGSRKPFRIVPFRNRNGTMSFRVTGLLGGLRVRENFRDRLDAEVRRHQLEIQRVGAIGSLHTAVTRLTPEQIREAEAAYQRLGGHSGPSLVFCVEHALSTHREADGSTTLADAVSAYVAHKKHELEMGVLSATQFHTIRRQMAVLLRHFPRETLGHFTVDVLTAFLQRDRSAPKTYHNRRGLVLTFFKFCRQKEWISSNPAKRTPTYRIARRRGAAQTLTAEQATELMQFLETYKRTKVGR